MFVAWEWDSINKLQLKTTKITSASPILLHSQLTSIASHHIPTTPPQPIQIPLIRNLPIRHPITKPPSIRQPRLFGEDHQAVLVLEYAVDCGGVGWVLFG
jgi:hypothetical protein